MRVRIEVVEEVREGQNIRYRDRKDLRGGAEGDCPSACRRAARIGMSQDKRFQDLEVVSLNFRDRACIKAVVKQKSLSRVYKIPGKV